MISNKRTKALITVSLMLVALLFAHSTVALAADPIGSGSLHILGVGLTADPSQQTAPINTGTAVNTHMELPNVDFGGSIGTPSDFEVVAELSGPGLPSPITVRAVPGGQLMIPPLSQKGTYVLDNIRLMSGDQVILYADPQVAYIDTIEKLLITNVVSRALSIDEIEKLGITIGPENFTAFKFTVGFGTETGPVSLELPVVMDIKDKTVAVTEHVIQKKQIDPDKDPVPQLRLPNIQLQGFKMDYPDEEPPLPMMNIVPPIAGVIVIPGDIAFLNQFFEVMLLVTNNSPGGSNLTVTDIDAQIFLPAGNDNIPGTSDDPLRLANTNLGSFSKVPVINKTGGRPLVPLESGEGKFLVEGVREGTHSVDIELAGTLQGLPVGPIKVKGKAKGTVIVRNPYFTLTFGQPDVVRAGEEYSLFVTINNISETDANLATLTLPPAEVYGATLIADSDPSTPVGTVRFRTIKGKDSAVAEFKLISRKTGKVTSTAFVGDDGVKGVFRLRTGVGDRGIPLSPDTIVLSSYVKHLPENLVYNAIRVLGMAHSVATAPSLPPGVTRISKSMLAKKAYEFTEAGLRVKMGEQLSKSVNDLLLDWLGNGAQDKGFEEVLRLTDAGRDFLFEAGNVISSQSAMNAQRAFGETVKYRTPFISAVIESDGQTSALLEITDSSGKSVGRKSDGSKILDVPYGVIVDLDGSADTHLKDMLLIDTKAAGSYDLKIKGVNAGYFNFGLIFPDENGGFSHAVYKNIQINPGEIITGTITTGQNAPVLHINTSNIYNSEVYSYVRNTGPKVISVMQLPEADLYDRGRVVAILLDEKIQPESANNPGNYTVVYRTLQKRLINPPKGVQVLPGKRIIEVMFQCSISPFFEYDLILKGIKDPSLNRQEPEPVRAPIITTLTKPGGIVSGTIRKGTGEAIPNTEVLLKEQLGPIGEEGSAPTITNRTFTDEEGNYQLDYVAMGGVFNIESRDPATGQKGNITSRIIMDRQHLVLDILLLGLGTLSGQVVKADDNSPVAEAYVEAASLTDSTIFRALTDVNGRFAFHLVPVGNINVSAELQYYSGAIGVNIPAAGATMDITVTVYNTQSMGSVKGRVLEADGITPVTNVPIIIRGSNYQKWKPSDAQGYYQFDKVPAGDVSVSSFRQETAEQVEVRGVVSAGNMTTLNLIFPGTATIVGTVYSYDGVTIAGAKVLSGATLVETDANGNYRIEKVPTGNVSVKALHPMTGEMALASAQISAPGEIVTVNVTFPEPKRYGTIQGYVKDAYGRPVPYQSIILYDGNKHYYASADRSGFFSKKDLPMGGYAVRMKNGEGTDGDNKTVTLAVDGQVATIELSYKGVGKVTGIVYQPDGVSPTVASVIVTHTRFDGLGRPYPIQERVISDQLTGQGVSGRYVVEKVRVGDFRLAASNAFYSQAVVKNGKVRNPDETVVMDIVLIPTSRVSGQVFLANGDRAGADLTVTLKTRTISEMQVKTKADGTYEFALVPPEPFTLSAYDPVTGNYGIARGSVETGDESVVDINILGKGTAKVKVIDGGGNPIPNAKVGLNSGSPVAEYFGEFPDLYSDQNGEVVFMNVPEGKFSVTAEDSRTLTGGKSGGEIPEDLTEVSVTVIASASGTVQGTIYTADESGTVPFAQVRLTSSGRPDFFTTSDSDGNYVFSYVPLGSFKLEVFHPGTARIGKGQGSVDYDTQVKTINITLIAQGTVEGYVYTASGSPVMAAKVEVTSKEISGSKPVIMTSNLEGRFKVSGIPEGKYSVRATYAYDAVRKISGMSEGQISTEGETVRTDVYLQPTGTIYGKTLSADSINPMPYAKLIVAGVGYSNYAVSDAEGNYSFPVVPVGNYVLTASEQVGYDAAQSSAAVSYEGHLARADIIFIGTGNITGKVTNSDGSPLDRAANLRLSRTGSIGLRSFAGYTDSLGNFAFSGIPSGDFSISATIPGSILGGVYNGTLTAGASLENIQIMIENSGEIHGMVLRNDNSTPVKDALIRCTVTRPTSSLVTVNVLTGADGAFSIAGIPLGQFKINVTDFLYGGTGTASGVMTGTTPVVNLAPVVLDETPPSVTGTSPAAGSVQVPLNSQISISFSEPIDPYYVTTYNIKASSAESVDGFRFR